MRKNKFLVGLCGLGLALSLASCGSIPAASNPTSGATTEATSGTNVETSATTVEKGFKVTVKYPNGNPVKNVSVQWCEKQCLTPVRVDDNGVAVNPNCDETKTYSIHVLGLPTGYGINPFAVMQNKDNKDAVVTLVELNGSYEVLADKTEGKKENPAHVSTGFYHAEVDLNQKLYLAFIPTEAGDYYIETLGSEVDVLNQMYVNVYASMEYSSSIAKGVATNKGKNSKVEFTVSSDDVANNKTFYALITIKDTPEAEYFFQVVKK